MRHASKILLAALVLIGPGAGHAEDGPARVDALAT
jgi:hypothetical protein